MAYKGIKPLHAHKGAELEQAACMGARAPESEAQTMRQNAYGLRIGIWLGARHECLVPFELFSIRVDFLLLLDS